MNQTAIGIGTFVVSPEPLAFERADPGFKLGRMSIDNQISGDLTASTVGQMLSAMTDTEGSAGYVAMERVEGTLNGKRGAFVLQHTGSMNRGGPTLVEDVPVLLRFIRAMAAFEKLTVTATEETLQAALFGERPAAHALLARIDRNPIGHAAYFFSFGSTTGRRGLWLDDLFLEPVYRGRGIGKALMAHLAEIARANGCARFEWMVLDWNAPAIAFYERLGAKIEADRRTCRLDEAGLGRLAHRAGAE